MKLAGLTVAMAALAAAGATHAQETQTPPTPPPDGAVAAADAEGILVFEPAYFASAQPQSAMDMVLRVPGFQFDGGDSVRGFGGAAGNVLIDGQRPASKRDVLEAVLRRVPASTVERIELIRGGAPGIDMQGKSVIVNVVRKTGASSQALFAVASSFLPDGRELPAARLEGSRRWDGKFVEGSVLVYTFLDDGAGEGPRVVRDPAGTVIQRSFADETADGYGLETKGSFETPLFDGKFRVNAALKLERFEYELDDRATFPTPFRFTVEEQSDINYETELGLQWERQLAANTTLELLAIQQFRDTDLISVYEDPADTSTFLAESFAGESIARAKLRYRHSDTLSFEGGGEVAYNFLERDIAYSENGTPIPLPAASVKVEEQRVEGFGTATWRASPQLTIEAGAKVEYSILSQSGDTNLEKEFVYPKPRLFVTWAPNEANQFRFRAEREVGQLNFGDFVSSASLSTGVVLAGNADLEPAKAWVLEGAWERRFWGKGALVLTATHERIEDVVDRIPVVDPSSCPIVGGVPDVSSPLCTVFSGVGNIDEATNNILSANLTLPLDRFRVPGGQIRFAGTWRDSEVADPTTGEERRISGQRPFSGEVNFSQDISKWRLNWGADAFFGWEETYYNVDQIESYELETWLRLWAEWKVRPNLGVRVEASNLTGRPFIRDREVYAGRRDAAPLLFTENRELKFDPFLYIRIRRTWG